MDKYEKIYKNKYKLSRDIYVKVLDNNNTYSEYLYYFDIMNVYSLFPSILDYKLEKYGNIDIKNIILNESPNYMQTTFIDTKFRVKINKKIKEIESVPTDIIDTRERNTVRKFFSYEIIDEIVKSYGGEYVTVAWLKCYEIIDNYNLITGKSDNIKYFGICEQPGAFVFSINHYCNTHGKKLDFILESLVDRTNKKIFRPQRDLYNEHKNKYDYGKDKTGDVTNMENIVYYREKYYDTYFDIISADCGLDCSNDFTLQESNLVNVVFGQFILSVALADKGTNYFFKVFTIYDNLMADLVYILNMLYENVYISRVLTTKPDSGELYIVCKNYLYQKNECDTFLTKLINWYNVIFSKEKVYDINNSRLLQTDDMNIKFYDKLNHINKIFGLRRLVSINMTIFRLYNNKFIADNPMIKEYVKKLAEHYMSYYLVKYRVKVLDKVHRLVQKEIESKWVEKKDDEVKLLEPNYVCHEMLKLTQNDLIKLEGIYNLGKKLVEKLNEPLYVMHKINLNKSTDLNIDILQNDNVSLDGVRNIYIDKYYKLQPLYFLHIYSSIKNILNMKGGKIKNFTYIKISNCTIKRNVNYPYVDLIKTMLNVNYNAVQNCVKQQDDTNSMDLQNDTFYILDMATYYKIDILKKIFTTMWEKNCEFEIRLFTKYTTTPKIIYEITQFLGQLYNDVYILKGTEYTINGFNIICMNKLNIKMSEISNNIHDPDLHSVIKILKKHIGYYQKLIFTHVELMALNIDAHISSTYKDVYGNRIEMIKKIFETHNIKYDKKYFE